MVPKKKSENKSRAQTVLSEGNILHLSDYEYKSLLEKQQAHCSIEIAGCIYRILRPSLIFLLELEERGS